MGKITFLAIRMSKLKNFIFKKSSLKNHQTDEVKINLESNSSKADKQSNLDPEKELEKSGIPLR